MRKTLFALVTAFTIFAATTPARAGYWEAAVSTTTSNSYAALAWFHGALQLHYAANYDYVDWSLIYNAWANAALARDNAVSAWWWAPIYSYTEYYALQAASELAAAADNLWYVYIYGGYYPQFATNAIVHSLWAQVNLGYAAQAAAGGY